MKPAGRITEVINGQMVVMLMIPTIAPGVPPYAIVLVQRKGRLPAAQEAAVKTTGQWSE